MQTTGRVVSIAVKNGQRVTKGQTLLEVDNTQAMNTLRTAEASLKHAQDGYDRVSKVHSKGCRLRPEDGGDREPISPGAVSLRSRPTTTQRMYPYRTL